MYVCSDHRLWARMWWFRRASSWAVNVSSQVVCGWYLPGKIGMKSLGLPKTIIAGDNLVARSGVFLYWRIACCTASTSSPPLGPVLLVRLRFMILTPISALQMLCGKATDDSPLWTPHVRRKPLRVFDWNSGPPSEASSSGMP